MNTWIARNIFFNILQVSYGEKIDKYLKELEKTQWLTIDNLKLLQYQKFLSLLKHSYNHIPYYFEKYSKANFSPNNFKNINDLCSIPSLTKAEIKNNFNALILNTKHYKRLEKRKTSGSTGIPLQILKDRVATGYMRAIDYRGYKWHGIQVGDKQGRLWGMPLDSRDRNIERIKDILLNRIRLSVLDISENKFLNYYQKLVHFKPKYLYGYSNALFEFAKVILDRNLKLLKSLTVIISTGEMLYEFQRKTIEKAFCAKVVNEYGTTENGMIALECPKGGMHIMADNVLVEIIKDGKPVKTGEKGEIIVTDLNNYVMPLIRYKIGDIGSYSENHCSCGRDLPMIESIEGREDSYLSFPGGKKVYDAIFAYVLKYLPKIKQFKVVQKTPDTLVIKIVGADIWRESDYEFYKNEIKKIIGQNINIFFKRVDNILPEKSGKMRYFVAE